MVNNILKLFLCSISIFALSALLFIIPATKQIEIGNMISVFGLIITSIAFIVGAYFALLAVDAYSHIQKIKNAKNEIVEITESSKLLNKTIASNNKLLAASTADIIDEFLSNQIYLNELPTAPGTIKEEMRGYIRKRRNDLQATRARILVQNKYLNSTRRVNLVMELSVLGNAADIEILKKITEDVQEEANIQMVAERAINSIQQRYHTP